MKPHQKIWLSGGTSGIGKGLALALLQRGHCVALTARRPEAIDAIIATLPPPQRERALCLAADVTDEGALQQAYIDLKQSWGTPDMVIANAGTHQHTEFDQIDYQDSRSIITLNLLGAIHMLTLPLRDMAAKGEGTLVGVASLAGYRGLPAAAAYGASKAGLINFLESLRFDAEPQGLRVQVVNPGFVKTPLTDRNPFTMPALVTVDEAVEAILKGLEQGQNEIHFPKRFSTVMKLFRVLPYPLYHRLIRRITKGGPS